MNADMILRQGGEMRRLSLLTAAVLLMAITASAKDAASLYKAKCAGCHGPDGAGKSGPKIAGTSEQQVIDVLTKGGQSKAPHTKPMSGLTATQAKQVAGYVQSLK